MALRRQKRVAFGVALWLALCHAGCEKDEDKPASVADGGTDDKQAAVDPSLAKAVAAASAKAGAETGAADQGEGPPPDGVFAPGAADKQLPRGAPPKITVGDAGREPRLRLASMQPRPGTVHPFGVELGIRVGRNMVPNLLFGLRLEVPELKAAPKDEGAPQAGAASALPQPVAAMVSVVDAELDPAQAARVPEEEKKLIRGFKGATIRYQVAPNGAAWGFSYQLTEKADQALQQHFDALGEFVATVLMPYPDQPMGKDGYWMATTRETIAGLDTVAYRLVRVTEVQGNTATLELNVKRYAASARINLAEAPSELGELTLAAFSATGNGTLRVQNGVPVPVAGKITSKLDAMAESSNAPGQRLPVLQATVTGELRSAPEGGASAPRKKPPGAPRNR